MTSNGTFKIDAHGDRDIVMTRTFAAPRERVFAAFTKPELLPRWLGPGAMTMTTCEIDLRAGGAYRWVWRLGNGKLMGMGGVFREVVPNERLVATEKFDEAWYPGEATVTQAFSEAGGKTTVKTTLRYESGAARDGVLNTPMQHGIAESYDRLDELLAAGAT
jgi:uncharacterized protein YndB with AHSA1/START domain